MLIQTALRESEEIFEEVTKINRKAERQIIHSLLEQGETAPFILDVCSDPSLRLNQ